MNKVANSWPACHEFEPHAAEDPPCRGNTKRVKSVEAQTSSSLCGVGWPSIKESIISTLSVEDLFLLAWRRQNG
ncbi:hypothetical protein TNCV_2195421 [Trichonephila clavipes]|uniref:Uncharacterized protein n=1 Tax=Trichonephila clavipes TaxID=2585209 RepID=A0A8X6SCN7_TRICX|nr:hypothetical protein TNCV_2195421 [Trichonephila clavipes]